MADVGSIILASRSLIPDAAQGLPAPAGLTSSQFAATPTLAAGTYLVSVTLVTGSSSPSLWRETTSLSLGTVVVDGTHGLQVTGTLPVGVQKVRVYYGVTAINQFQDFTTLPAQVSTPGTAGTPPTV